MKIKYLIAVTLMVLVSIGIFLYLQSNTNKPIRVEIELVNTTGDDSINRLSDLSLYQLRKVIEDNMIVRNQNQLIDLFNKERSQYINLITILAILLTVFSLFSIISSFVEKNEIENISKSLESKIKEYDTELKKIFINSLKDEIIKKKTAFNNNVTLLLDGSQEVNDYISFYKYFDITTQQIFQRIKEKDIYSNATNNHFYVEYLNYTISAIDYAFTRHYIPVKNYDVSFNEILRISVSKIHNFLKKDDFNSFKEIVNSSISIEWGSY